MAISKIKKIVGLSGSDYLYGTSLADYIYGLGGNDFMRGGRGNDFLYGGTGKDTPVFSGKFSDYNFSTVSGGLYVTHARGTRIDGRDFVARDVECLKFADRTINLALNYKPVANADTNGANAIIEKGGLNNATPGDASATGNVLANDTDIDVTLGRQVLRVANPGTYAGTYGTLQLASNGAWTYTLNDADADTEGLSAGQIATETFFYTASDGKGGTAVGKLTLSIQGTNDTPTANSDAASANENGAGVLIDVLANDTDVDSDDGPATLKIIAATSAKGVPVSFTGAPGDGLVYQTSSTGIFEYLAEGETTTDTITYTIEDSHGAQSTSTVTVTITGTNDAPVFAQTPATEFSLIGNAVQVNTQADGSQFNSYISVLADNKFLVTWVDVHDGARKGQLLDSTGAKLGGEFVVMAATNGFDSGQIQLVDGRVVAYSFTGPVFGKIIESDGSVQPIDIPHITGKSGYIFTAALAGGVT